MPTRNRAPRRAARGFTLIESLLALAVLLVGLLTLAQLQARAVEASAQSRTQLRATHLAAEQLETLRAAGFAAVSAGADEPPAATGDNAHFSRDWRVEDAAPGWRLLHVRVQWQGSDGDERSIALSAALADSAWHRLDEPVVLE